MRFTTRLYVLVLSMIVVGTIWGDETQEVVMGSETDHGSLSSPEPDGGTVVNVNVMNYDGIPSRLGRGEG